MRIVPVPCLKDNYAYLLIDDASHTAVVIDPSEGPPVLAALEREGVGLHAIWLTHHHWDHVGGVDALVEAYPGIEVLGSVHDKHKEQIPHQTRGLKEGDELSFAGHRVDLYEIPGHTLGAIAYVIAGELFSGDTLFVAGCGRVFEGTMEMMSQSLSKLRDLPPETRVWCGHEYTVRNLEYAATVEPDSEAVKKALSDARAARERGELTVPGRLSSERATNPFFRFDVPEVARDRDPVACFTALREGKDRF